MVGAGALPHMRRRRLHTAGNPPAGLAWPASGAAWPGQPPAMPGLAWPPPATPSRLRRRWQSGKRERDGEREREMKREKERVERVERFWRERV